MLDTRILVLPMLLRKRRDQGTGSRREWILLNLSRRFRHGHFQRSSRRARFATVVESTSTERAHLGIVVVNLSLAAVATRLSKSERHPTRILEETSAASALFLFLFINTAVSTLVATTHIPRLTHWAKRSSLKGHLFAGVYVDTTPNWYREVGRSLMITMIVHSAARIARIIARWLVFKVKFCCRGRALTQNQLNEAYMGPDFTLAPRYGELLNLIFVAMFFGGGLFHWGHSPPQDCL